MQSPPQGNTHFSLSNKCYYPPTPFSFSYPAALNQSSFSREAFPDLPARPNPWRQFPQSLAPLLHGPSHSHAFVSIWAIVWLTSMSPVRVEIPSLLFSIVSPASNTESDPQPISSIHICSISWQAQWSPCSSVFFYLTLLGGIHRYSHGHTCIGFRAKILWQSRQLCSHWENYKPEQKLRFEKRGQTLLLHSQ